MRRGAEVVLSAPHDGPVAAAGAGRVRLIEPRVPVPPGLDFPRALAVGLVLVSALELLPTPLDPGLDALADLLDAEAERNQPGHEPFMNPAKSLALRLDGHTPLLWGTDAVAAAVAGHAAPTPSRRTPGWSRTPTTWPGPPRRPACAAHSTSPPGAATSSTTRSRTTSGNRPPRRRGSCCSPRTTTSPGRRPCGAPAAPGRPRTCCTPSRRCPAAPAHAAVLRAALLASRLDVAAVYLGLGTRTIEPA